jgi:hypothetical protein
MGRTLSSKGRRAAVGGGLLAALALLFAAAESNTGMLPVFALLGYVLSVPAGALLGLSFADYDPLIYLLWFDLVVAAVAVGEAGALAAERLRTALST